MDAAEIVVGEVESAKPLSGRSVFFEKAFVSRVNRRICIRIVRFFRSMCEVHIRSGSALPVLTLDMTCLTSLVRFATV